MAALKESVSRIYERAPKTAAERDLKRMLEFTPGLPRKELRQGCYRTTKLFGNS